MIDDTSKCKTGECSNESFSVHTLYCKKLIENREKMKDYSPPKSKHVTLDPSTVEFMESNK